MKRVHKNAALALFLLLGGGGPLAWIYLNKVRTSSEREAAKHEEKRLFHFAPERVAKGVIHARGATIAFAREGAGGWRITSPVDTPADPVAIDNAMERMAKLEGERADTGEVTAEVLARYELARPKTWIEVDTSEGPFTLLVGPKNLDGRFFVTDGARKVIRLADGTFYWAIDRGLDSFRDPRIFPIPPKEVLEIAVREQGKTRFVLSRDKEEGAFVVSDGAHPPVLADDGDANLILVAVATRLMAERWVTDALASDDPGTLEALGMKHFDLAIEVRSAKKTMRGVLGFLKETSASRVASIVRIDGTGSVAEVPDWIRTDLDKRADALVDRRVARFDGEAVREIKLTLGSGAPEIAIRRLSESGHWIMGADNAPVAGWKAEAIVRAFSRLRAERWVDGEVTPTKRVRFYDSSGTLLADILIGKEIDKKTVAVMAAGAKRTGACSKHLVELLPEKAADLAP